MDFLSQYYSDQQSFGSEYSGSIGKPDTPPFSDSCDAYEVVGRTAHSDGDIILASNQPKKRAGRRVFKETRHPVYRGVREKSSNKWVCELREPNKKSRIWLGTYPTAEMAARAHDVAALAFRGKSACLNFADSGWRLPQPTSKDAMEIRRVAAEAAEAFRPQESGSEEVMSNEVVVMHEQTNSEASAGVGSSSVERPAEGTSYMDEEVIFGMPGLLTNMAEGLLMSPPKCPDDDEIKWDDLDSICDLPLWSHSI